MHRGVGRAEFPCRDPSAVDIPGVTSTLNPPTIPSMALQTPLMRKPHSQETLCVTCNSRTNAAAQRQQAPQAESSVDDAALSPQSLPDEIPSLAQRMREVQIAERQQQRSSEALAEYMLRGWTLLGDACPRYEWGGTGSARGAD